MKIENSTGSVTQWIEDLKREDPEASEKIWHRFVQRLVSIANQRIRNSNCRMVDGDDIAAEAFRDFFVRKPDSFARLLNRNDLWQILAKITERRAIDAIRRETSLKQGGGTVVSEATIYNKANELHAGIDSLPGNAARPDIEMMLIEAFEERLDSLNNDQLRQMAVDRLHGLSNPEVAEKHGVSCRSVERKFAIIKQSWIADL